MSRTIHHILAIAALALLTLGVGSCVEPLDPSLRPEGPSVSFWIYVPGSMQQPVTKGLPGDVASLSPESTLKDVQVWAFRHGAGDDEAPLSTATVSNIDWKHSGTTPRSWDDCYEMSMPIPEDFLKDSDPRIDFYVLANWRSIFSTKPASQTTLKQVRDMVYDNGVNRFGVENPTRTVPGTGLPISTVYKGEDGNGVSLIFLKEAYEAGTKPTQELFKEKLKVIELKRTVSKLRFVISRPEGMDGVSITKIIVNDTLIPFDNWVFEKETPILPQPATYSAAVLELKGSGSTEPFLDASKIGQAEDPEIYTSAWFEENKPDGYAQTAQGYNNYLADAIAGNKAREEVVYLRETDKAISGTVYYKLSDDAKEPYAANFTMSNLDNGYNNFHRNHFWTVYAYFEADGNLYVNPTVADWTDAPALEYTLNMSTNMRLFDSWLYRYDTDGKYGSVTPLDPNNPKTYDNWAESHMAVSEGREAKPLNAPDDFVAGRPLRSPQIQLVTTGSGTYQLMVDNSDFEIIRANKNGIGVVTSYESSTEGVLTIKAPVSPAKEVYTYFYIVPKVGVTPSNPVAKVSLIYNDPVTGPQKVTFNYSSLPGYSDDSSEIWVYYFPADEYNITGKIRMYYKDYNNPLVPTPVQI